jgi:SAM-dependent methyltransferase
MRGDEAYVIASGSRACDRLSKLAVLFAPTTSALLNETLPWARLRRVVDVGCGLGRVAALVAEHPQCPPDAVVVGLDLNAEVVDAARGAAAASQAAMSGRLSFHEAGIADAPQYGPADAVVVRCLLSHLPDVPAALSALFNTLRPGGMLIVEDVHAACVASEPAVPALARLCEWYAVAARARGASPDIADELPRLLCEAGFNVLDMRSVMPALRTPWARSIHADTMVAIAHSVEAAGLASKEEIEVTVAELSAWADRDEWHVTLPRTLQVVCLRPEQET